MHYLTQDDYAKAAKRGISKNVLYQRYYILKWSLEDAMTKPVEHRNLSDSFKYWVKVAAEHGIDYYTFRWRVHKAKWGVVKAATQPTGRKKKDA